MGISELAKRLGVAKSTVHRLAGALLDEGLLQQNPENGRYRLGVGLFSLGSLVRSRLDVTSESKHILNDLREKSQENVRLAVLERQSVVFLHDFESPQTLRLRSGTGQLRPAFCTAEGLCLLSGLREPELTNSWRMPAPQRTPKTVTDEEALRERIRKVKRQGYAIEDEECDEGTRCIAAPIYHGDGRIVAARRHRRAARPDQEERIRETGAGGDRGGRTDLRTPRLSAAAEDLHLTDMRRRGTDRMATITIRPGTRVSTAPRATRSCAPPCGPGWGCPIPAIPAPAATAASS